MSDQTQTSETQTNDPANELASIKAERDALAGQVKDLTTQRDTFASQVKEFDTVRAQLDAVKDYAEIKAEKDKLAGQVDKYVKREREAAVVSKLRTNLPHVEEFAISGALAKLHEEGVIDRHAEKSDEVASKALELIKARMPGLAKAPVIGGGGEHGKQPVTPPSRLRSSPI